MTKSKNNTLEWLREHIKPGEKIIVPICMNDSSLTPTGVKLQALIYAVQSMGAAYQFFVEINSPEYYETWKTDNAEILKDPHLVASGGVKDIRELHTASGLSNLREDYLKSRKGRHLPGLLKADIEDALKTHPEESEDSAEKHIINAAVDCIVMHRPRSIQNNLKNHLWYPHKKLSNTAVHACTIAPRFGFESGSLNHFPYNMGEVLELYYKKDQQLTTEAQQVVSSGSEEKGFTTPPLKPMSQRRGTNSPPHKLSKKTGSTCVTPDPDSDPAPMLLDEVMATTKCNLNYDVNKVTALVIEGMLRTGGEDAAFSFLVKWSLHQYQIQLEINKMLQSQSQLPPVQNTQQIQQVLFNSMDDMKKVRVSEPSTTTTFELAQQMSSKMRESVSPSASSAFLPSHGTTGTMMSNVSSSRDALFPQPTLRKVASCPDSLSLSPTATASPPAALMPGLRMDGVR